MKRNYQKELEKQLEYLETEKKAPALLLHSCCAPCSSYVLEYLSQYFKITVFYYNPNIYPEEEYVKRVEEQQNFIKQFPAKYKISFLEGTFDKEQFYQMAKGLEEMKEGGERCFGCYELRLKKTAECAKILKIDYFTTTLSISPLKNAEKLNEIGERLGKEYGVKYLNSDFKKKNGYQRSVELSKEYAMYRQDYCGCVFSMREREANKEMMDNN
ncbi:MAG: epoxyqueuosine reductase QueH [Lachnospiraceae bacterium]